MEELKSYLQSTSRAVEAFVKNADLSLMEPPEIREGALLYFNRGGKRLRPALTTLFAGAYGGEEREKAALGAACAIELFHNWTLIHDDIIDKDMTRRGGPSVQAYVDSKFEHPNSFEYATDAAILAGDSLHALSARTFAALPRYGVRAELALALLELSEGETVDKLIMGETLDTRFALIGGEVTEDDVKNMIAGKTGALFALCAMAGTMIGLDITDRDDPRIKAAARFGFDCGLAFQLKDDVLGIISDEKTLGKPIGGDIKEGKDTLIKLYALSHAKGDQLSTLKDAMGNRNADDALIEKTKKILSDCGAVAYADGLAREASKRALESLSGIEDSRYKELIVQWARLTCDRSF